MTRILAITLITLGLAAGAYGLLKPRPAATAASAAFPTGVERPLPGATFVNGFNIVAYPNCDLARAYAGAEAFTGPPVAAWDGRGMSFTFMRLTCDLNDPANRVRFDALGAQAMRARGMTPLPDSAPHPAVSAFLVDTQQAGLNVRDLFGRVISAAHCQGGSCEQYLENALLAFSPTEVGSVRLAPLGCQLQLACARAQLADRGSDSPLRRNLPWLVSGVALVAIGGFLVMRRRLTNANPMTI